LSFSELFDSDTENNDVNSTSPSKKTSNPLDDFLKRKSETTKQAQADDAPQSSPDPISEFIEGAKYSVAQASSTKGKAKKHTRRTAMPRQSSRTPSKQQSRDQDQENMIVRRSSRRDPNAIQKYYGNPARKRKSVSDANITSSQAAPDASKWTPWSKRINAGKVLPDLRKIDPEQYIQYED
jgi:hypothetical protein